MVWELLGDALDRSRALLGSLGMLLGCFWSALGRFWGASGQPWDALGVLLEHLGTLLERLGMLFVGVVFWSVFWERQNRSGTTPVVVLAFLQITQPRFNPNLEITYPANHWISTSILGVQLFRKLTGFRRCTKQ